MYMHKILCCSFGNDEHSVMIIKSTNSCKCSVWLKRTVIMSVRLIHVQLCKSGVDFEPNSYVDIRVDYEQVWNSSILA